MGPNIYSFIMSHKQTIYIYNNAFNNKQFIIYIKLTISIIYNKKLLLIKSLY